MPTIDDLQYGYDSSGIEAYLEAIKANALDKAILAVQNIESIKNVCEAEWVGHSKDQFVTNLEKDANFVADQFQSLYDVLVSEINSIQYAMASKDQNLIK